MLMMKGGCSMDSLRSMNNALAYIEEHLTEGINYSEVSKFAYCSEYHFKRMFSFLAGISLSEYIRRRRLSLAAIDLKDKDLRIIELVPFFCTYVSLSNIISYCLILQSKLYRRISSQCEFDSVMIIPVNILVNSSYQI